MYTNVYDSVVELMAAGGLDWTDGSIWCALMADTYVPDPATQRLWGDVSSHEVSTTLTGYSPFLCGQRTVTPDHDTRKTWLALEDPHWSSLDLDCAYAVFYRGATLAADRHLLCYIDFEGVLSPTNDALTITLPSSGILAMWISPGLCPPIP